ncbi:tRNA (adenosine(37)-N6)-threonylcarbamoyltransferase complex transferase subunit TsaD [Segatella bryantii]|uniref:tRNA (adenosine(37)-N6)-threonylcarbamoyltransferase complex transferase subunit TsaD n=1 Tax=Segatella bryantii TaxID=77095 RepID=UPI00241DEF2B|nr:tRNA (adenosine(37)-N6)-threonylcarbamoyltransferase complex transferase subunit TsaD [Segatella bryantii]
MKDIYCLAIESSCDETSMSIIKNGVEEIETVVVTQIDIHKRFGGVVPEIASRNHVISVTMVLDELLTKANMIIDDIDIIGVTYGPGLIGSLLVGVECAKTIALVTGKPLVPVHHIAGHIYANNLKKRLEFPLIALVVSGGHTDLVYMKEDYSFERIGSTLDDAVGEAYDKVAKILGLDYPGGPIVDKLAHMGTDTYELPYPLNDASYNFSFSGIKSAVVNLVHNEKQRGNDIRVNDLCTSFQNRVVGVLVKKTRRAIREHNVKNFVVAGGVAANSFLRESLEKMAKEENIGITFPEVKYCTDNGAMIGAAAYYAYKKGIVSDLKLNAMAIDSLYSGTKSNV